ncbi:Peptidase M1 membrane alanine aminopeptidase [Cyclobacterium marinum DSM 745]|uniref:Aminopeptidase N n=2 Tax=Cyclobacterium marinum TaxID=104 RepID=G0IX88_CYCMS|nr:Peptidase M1 membrane alanine aminopeptidase [Cyclobacterium marinum DSM 745]
MLKMRSTYSASTYCIIAILLFFSCKSASTIKPEPMATDRIPTDSLKDGGQVHESEAAFEQELRLREYRGSRSRDFDLLHTNLELAFDYKNRTVEGNAILTLKPYAYPQEELVLDAKDFEIHKVSLIQGDKIHPLNFDYDQEKLTLPLPERKRKEDTLQIAITYTAFPEKGNKEGSAAITDTKGLYFINPDGEDRNKPVQIWTQGETVFSSKWFPTIDSPNERQTHDFYLTVPNGYLSLSNGELLDSKENPDGTRTDHWQMAIPHAPYLSAIVVGKFSSIEENVNGVRLRYFVEPKYEAGAKGVFGHTPEMITFFSDLLDMPFPWQKYDQVVVRDFVSGAMENTTLSIFMEALNLNEREALDTEWDYIIAHELFHQWFGNYVTTESWANLALNEAFADYSEYLWFEYKEGRDQADMHHFNAIEQYLAESEEKQLDLIRYYYEDSEDMFDNHTYAKGGRILHMLRKLLGDEVFFDGLRSYLKQNALSSVEVHDLRLALEKASGQDLNWFFNQWFLSSGHPQLKISWDETNPDNILLKLEQEQDFSQSPLFKLPFKVSIYKEGQRIEKSYILNKAVQEFALQNGAGTQLAIFDEYSELLSLRSESRGFEKLEKQFLLSTSGLARVEALDSLTSNYTEQLDYLPTLERALEDPFHVVRELALHRMNRLDASVAIKNNLEHKVLKLVEEDPDNAVRAAALEALAGIGGSKYQQLFYRLINAPSYQVSGAALTAYLDIEGNAANKEELFERLKDEENIRIIAPLADYLTREKKAEGANWMHEKLGALTGESLYYFLGYYGDFFASVEGVTTGDAVSSLGEIASTHKLNYVRLAAYQSLFGFIDDAGVLELAKSIQERETDEMVREYEEYYLSPYLEGN